MSLIVIFYYLTSFFFVVKTQIYSIENDIVCFNCRFYRRFNRTFNRTFNRKFNLLTYWEYNRSYLKCDIIPKYYFNSSEKISKPIIYLYPEKQMEIDIQLNIIKNMKITVVYPKFNDINNTWKVKAKPNGDIIINNKKYPYLFYELESYVPQFQNEGFIVKDEEAEIFLENKLKILGLNDKESTDFITYWLPILLKNKLSLCTFQNEAFFNSFKLNINPKPDTLIRIFLSIKKIDSIPNIKEQKLEKIERKGFTVIEWGGSNLINYNK